MKTKLLLVYLSGIFFSVQLWAQAPTIDGDTMLCPNDNGTIQVTNSTTYDTYQWYYKYWFEEGDFLAIAGATASSFTFDWYTYDQSLFKVVVTLGGNTYESNTLQIDSYVWMPMFTMHEPNDDVTFDPNTGNFLICDGTSFVNEINNPPYGANIQWYRDGMPIAGANSSSYAITEPGEYYVEAAPSFCPNSLSTSLPMYVAWNPDCAPNQIDPPHITGDTMLCPDENGTAQVTNPVFDTYQWYYKYWFEEGDFLAIAGATASSFTYDWYTYDQAVFKVIATLNGETYESNTIQIDSYAWSPMFLHYEMGEGVSFDPETETILLCQDASVELNINNPPYSANIQWYKDGMPVADANNPSFVVDQPGEYYVEAAPGFCPNSITNSLPLYFDWDPNCSLNIDDPVQSTVKIFPNPTYDFIYVEGIQNQEFNAYQLYEINGKLIISGKIESQDQTISLEKLSKGIYFLTLSGNSGAITTHKIIKE